MRKEDIVARIVTRNVKIEIPVRKAIMLIQSPNIDWEYYFVKQIASARDNISKKEFDVCRAVVKWAKTCGGRVNYCKNAKNFFGKSVIEFEIVFSDRDAYIKFDEDFDACVTGAVM